MTRVATFSLSQSGTGSPYHSPPVSLSSLRLEVGTLNPARSLGSAVSSPAGSRGGAPAEIDFGAF